MACMILMQGRPGSGKSTRAKWLQDQIRVMNIVVSTDSKFMVDGEYKFDPAKLTEYHTATQELAEYYAALDYTVIVDNCNLLQWHAQPYINIAKKHNMPIVVIPCTKHYGSTKGMTDDECLNRTRETLETD